jgi:hypothetical protein
MSWKVTVGAAPNHVLPGFPVDRDWRREPPPRHLPTRARRLSVQTNLFALVAETFETEGALADGRD